MNAADKRHVDVADDAGLPEVQDNPRDGAGGVRRVNNVPLLIIGGVLLVFVILVASMITRRAEVSHAASDAAQGVVAESPPIPERLLIEGATAGLVEDAEARESSMPAIPVAPVPDDDLPPLPPRRTGGTVPAPAIADAQADERMSLLRSALRAKTSVATPDAVPAKPHVPDDAAKPPPTEPPSSTDAGKTPNGYASFDRKAGTEADRWALDTALEAPRSAYALRAGAVIPAIMISGVNSDIPGQIIAQVSQDVFDTATGRYRLIPQGARLIGRYDHHVLYGQSRLLVAWQRIVFPDGKALDIGAMDGVDGAGYAGFSDKVDRHYLRILGSAVFLSGITAGLTSSTTNPQNDPYGTSNATILSQSLAQQLGMVATEMLRKNLDVAPTLRIRPGYRFHVMAVKDMTFDRPYTPFR